MKYSIIVPVYNRPDEVDELLASLCSQTLKDFEVIIVEDGSQKPCKDVCDKYANILDLHYYLKENSGPGQSRNYGVERAQGQYVIILSFFTTGGIRGGKAKLDKFYPRSFNMGIRRDVYQELGGFSKMRFGEDIDFSYRIVEAGYQPRLFPDAWVWHKRRTDFRKFFRQVYNSGIARVNLEKRHPGTLKLVHLLPMVFTLGVIGLMLLAPFTAWLSLLPLLLYALIICTDASLQNKSLHVGLLSIPAAFVQLMGYGLGFLESWWKRCVRKHDEFTAFEKNFYK